MKPIIIMGAGLSGLACALTLSRAGKRVLVLEKKDKVGGRVSTTPSQAGFLIDEGFQVLLSSYPELSQFVDLESLQLRSFNSGAMVFNGQGLELLANPFRHPLKSLDTLKFSAASLKDKALVVKLMAEVLMTSPPERMGNQTTLDYLIDFGFSQHFLEDFWKPFLTGVYLDPSLSVSSEFFKFLMTCFAWGQVTLPEAGMNQLPQAMAKQLPLDAIRLNTEVKTWDAQRVALENGEFLEASSVVCSFGQTKSFRSATTFYFTSPLLSSLGWEKWLVLVPPRFGLAISHLALVSSVSKSYSPAHKPLLSVTLAGDRQCSEAEVMAEVEKVAGKELKLVPVATTKVPYALPVIQIETSGFETKDGVWFCGDRFACPSINGALRSGRLAAEAIIELSDR